MAKVIDREEREAQREGAHRQIIPVAGDEAMAEWLEGLFDLSPKPEGEGARVTKPKPEPDAFPERIVLRPIYGLGGRDKGDPIGKPKEWKPTQSPVPNPEQIVQMANSFLADAQRECNVHQRQQRFALFASSSLKGPEPYAKYAFALLPTGKEWGKSGPGAGAADSEDTHRDRVIETTLAHYRWGIEHNSEVLSGTMKLQQEIILRQNQTISQMESDRRAMLIASEQALSQKEERDEKRKMAEFKREKIEQGFKLLLSFAPSVKDYLQGRMKTRVDIASGLHSLIESLSNEERLAFFGNWNEADECIQPGILDPDQVRLILRIVEGHEAPIRLNEVVAGLRFEQMDAAQKLLKPEQIQQLGKLAQAAGEQKQQPAVS